MNLSEREVYCQDCFYRSTGTMTSTYTPVAVCYADGPKRNFVTGLLEWKPIQCAFRNSDGHCDQFRQKEPKLSVWQRARKWLDNLKETSRP